MIRVILIRHGATQGNFEKRYVGTTDEGITEESAKQIKEKKYPLADVVYVSPMLRCRQTADIIYPNVEHIVIENFRECDFGDFEGKNCTELESNQEYQKWIQSGGRMQFPNGESTEDFKERCLDNFYEICEELMDKYKDRNVTIALVVHGGTIMSIMESFIQPKSDFFSWQVANGNGYETVCMSENELRLVGKL